MSPGLRAGRHSTNRPRRVAGAALCALLLGAPAASAQPPGGIVRPGDEAATPLTLLGPELFSGNCASCHGILGGGITSYNGLRGAGNIRGEGPSLRGVGAAAADFYLRTGRMPLDKVGDQPTRSRPAFNARERRSLIQFIASLKSGPPIPVPDPARGNVSEGMGLFTEHCAGCHQVVAQGGFVTGARVPPLGASSNVDVAEAVRIGPYVMPRFSKRAISDRQLDSLIAYVDSTKPPDDRGGWGIGNIGPVPEGLVTWLIAAVALVATCMAIGRRYRA